MIMTITTHQDFLPKNNFNQIKIYLNNNKSKHEKYPNWTNLNGISCCPRTDIKFIEILQPFILKLIQFQVRELCQKKINKLSGFEWWINRNKIQGWHVDKDEVYYRHTKKIKLATQSYVFYINKPCIGGELEFNNNAEIIQQNNVKVEPNENCLTTFCSSYQHRVLPFSGERLSLAFNYFTDPPVMFNIN